MNKLGWCLLVLATAIVCTESHRLLSAEKQAKGRSLAELTEATALEHQRILAELEEVHQLRERMLQQGGHIQPPFFPGTASVCTYCGAKEQPCMLMQLRH